MTDSEEVNILLSADVALGEVLARGAVVSLPDENALCEILAVGVVDVEINGDFDDISD